MKKIYVSLMLTLIFGCTKSKIENATVLNYQPRLEQSILEDKIFKEYTADAKQFLNRNFDLTEIKRLMAIKNLTSKDQNDFTKALGFDNGDQFMEFARSQTTRLKYLNEKYHIKDLREK